MQWLINIIQEWLQLNHGYFDRGDPAAEDFVIGDFTKDGFWHDLTLPAVVPTNARAVLLHSRIQSTVINKSFWVKASTVVNDISVGSCFTQIANLRRTPDFIVAIDNPDRKIKYLASPANLNVLNLTVKGWWL